MCGIVGYVGDKGAVSIIVEGLKRLEYRGYDSAGIAVLNDGTLHVRRAAGRLKMLEGVLGERPLAGSLGIGHTRWATHGRPTEENAHPHRDCKGKIVVLEEYNLDCPFCHNHFKTGAMQDLQSEMTGKGVIWLLVNSVNAKNPGYRNPEAAKKEWAEQKIKATAWIDDSSGELGKKYGMRTTPHMFVIDKSGILAYQGAIDDRPSPEAIHARREIMCAKRSLRFRPEQRLKWRKPNPMVAA